MNVYIKRFNDWGKRKQQLDQIDFNNSFYYKEREVWWVSVGVNIGVEIDGKHDTFERPVLVFRKINRRQCYGFPLTSKEKTGTFYFPITYGESTGMVCLSQLRAFDIKRFLRKIDIVSESEFKKLQDTTVRFFAGEYL